MRLELRLKPDEGPRVMRQLGLPLAKGMRARSRPLRIVWHDGGERPLGRAGLALAEERNAGWWVDRLDRVDPILAQRAVAAAAAREDLDVAMPDPLVPIAAFIGREVTHSLLVDGTLVTVTLRRGVARAVTEEHAIARIVLEGPDEAVFGAAIAIAQHAHAGIPTHNLAHEALIGSGAAVEVAAEAQGALTDIAATPEDAFRRLLGHQLGVLLRYAPLVPSGDTMIEAVHQMRVAVRRARAAVSAFRPAIGCEHLERGAERLRALSGCLGSTRDWDVFVTETLPMVMDALPASPSLRGLLRLAETQRRTARAALRTYLESAEFRVLTTDLGWLVASHSWPPTPFAGGNDMATFSASVLERRHHRLMRGGRRIETLDTTALHALRLKAKRARYAAEMFAGLYPHRGASRYIRRLSRLQQSLGILNDDVVASGLIQGLGATQGRHAHAGGLVMGYLAGRLATSRREMVEAWEKVRRADRFWARPR